MSPPLKPDRIRELYAAFNPEALGWTEWITASLPDMEWVQTVPLETLRSREGQTRLWAAKGFGPAGASENLPLGEILEDAHVVSVLTSLRGRAMDPSPSRRGAELQALFDELQDHIRARVPSKMPVARLFRCFALLRPGDGHAGLSWESHRAIRELLVGQKRAKRLETSVLARARLRDALGPERESARGELAEHVHRGMFCWWLYEHAAAIQAGDTPQAPAVPVIVDTPTTTASDTPLVLWSPERQIAWIQTFKGGLPTVRMLLRECLESQIGRAHV